MTFLDGPLHVLVVDDNPGDRRLTRELMQGSGERVVRVLEAPDVRSGLDLLSDEPCDVVLLDLNLGPTSGLESLRRFREGAPDVPIVVLSGRTDERIAIESLRSGASDYVMKGEESGRRLERVVSMVLERERLASELQWERSTHLHAADLVEDGLVTLDRAGRVVSANRSARTIFAATRVEMAGLRLSDHVRGLEVLLASAGTGGRTAHRVVGRRFDGAEVPLELGVRAIPDREPGSFLVVVRDITAEVASREAIRRLESEYELLLNSAGQGIVGLDVEGHVTFANPAALGIFGVAAEELIGHRVEARLESLGGRPVPTTAELIRGATAEIGVRRPVGSTTPVAATSRPLGDPSAPEGAVMILEDRSERHRLEEQFRQAQKMEAIGQLAGGIAHDFNNELAVISLNSILLRDELQTLGVEAPDVLDEIRDATERATRITRQLLNMSRRAELHFRPVDLTQLLGRTGALLAKVMPESIHVRTGSPTDQPRLSHVDAGALEQALLNLATNARDAMPDGGELEITVDTVTVGTEFRLAGPVGEHPRPGEYHRISVRDTGSGIPEDTLPRILEPFFTTKPQGRGTGLGLPMVYGLMKQMNGFLDVESRVGVGTTLHLCMPAARSGSPAAAPAVAESTWEGDGSGFVVLVVEDEDPLRKACRQALERYGFSVLEARDGAEALEVFEGAIDGVDVVLSDNVMPRQSGARLCQVLRARHGPVPFVMMTGYSQALPGELDDVPVLQKPWRLDTLLDTVWRELHRLDPNTLEGSCP